MPEITSSIPTSASNQPQPSTNEALPNHGLQLRRAAANGDTEKINELIQLGVDLEGRSSNGNTALHWAALNGHHDVVTRLCESKANTFACNSKGETPLIIAKTKDIETTLINNSRERAELLFGLECTTAGRQYRQKTAARHDAFMPHIEKNTAAFKRGLELAAQNNANPSVLIKGPSDLKDIVNIETHLTEAEASCIDLVDMDRESLTLAMEQLPSDIAQSMDVSDLTAGVASQFFTQCINIIKACDDPNKARALIGKVIDKLTHYQPVFETKQYDYVVSPEVISQLSGAQHINKRFQAKYNAPLMTQDRKTNLTEKISDFALRNQMWHIERVCSQLKPTGVAMIAFTSSEGPYAGGRFGTMVDERLKGWMNERFTLVDNEQSWTWTHDPAAVKLQRGGSYQVECYLVQHRPENFVIRP